MTNEPNVTNTMRDAVEGETTKKSRKHQYLHEDELVDVLEQARKASARDWSLLCSSYWHGLRNQEAALLKLSAIDQQNNMLIVQRLKSSELTRQPIKEEKGRPVLNEMLALKTWLAERKRQHPISDYIYTSNRDGSCLGQKQVNRLFAHYCKLASEARTARGDKAIDSMKWHIHSLKRTRGTLMGQKGVPILDIKYVLGHKSVRNCEVYVCMNEQDAWDHASKIEATYQSANSWNL